MKNVHLIFALATCFLTSCTTQKGYNLDRKVLAHVQEPEDKRPADVETRYAPSSGTGQLAEVQPVPDHSHPEKKGFFGRMFSGGVSVSRANGEYHEARFGNVRQNGTWYADSFYNGGSRHYGNYGGHSGYGGYRHYGDVNPQATALAEKMRAHGGSKTPPRPSGPVNPKASRLAEKMRAHGGSYFPPKSSGPVNPRASSLAEKMRAKQYH